MRKFLKITTVVIILVMLFVVFFLYRITDSMSNYPAEDTLSGFFDMKPDSVSNLRGSGTAWMGYDVYIRFESTKKFSPKDFESAVSIDIADPKTFFLEVFPKDQILLDAKDLSCEFDPGKKDAPNSDGTWFCFSPKNKTHWFRSWWIS